MCFARIQADDSALLEMRMKKRYHFSIILVVVLCGLACLSQGCQSLRKLIVKPPPEGAVALTEAIPIFSYNTTAVVKATPGQFTKEIVEDILWLEMFGGGLLQLKLAEDSPDTDLAEKGKRIKFTIKVLNFPLRCEVVNVKYHTDNKIWLLLLTEMDGWLLMRFDLKPVPEGCLVTLQTIGYPPFGFSESTASQVFRIASERQDILLAMIQSKFDPSVSPAMARKHGLRGEINEVLLKANQVQVWIDESPEVVSKWIAKSENFEKILAPEVVIDQKCLDMYDQTPPGKSFDAKYMLKLSIVRRHGYMIVSKDERDVRIYFAGPNNFTLFDLNLRPEALGTIVTCKVSFEIMPAMSPDGLNLLLAIAGMQEQMQKRALMIKHDIEQ